MRLPEREGGDGVEIGISDILAWRDCAMRAKAGRRRLNDDEMPESWSPENAYGSAIHLCLSMLDEGATQDECVVAATGAFKQWLEPADIALLREDMDKYLTREMLGVRTLLNEGEISVPLFVHPVVGQVWFRARIDRLYQSLEDPGLLVHLDFKSSKHAKSEDEVAKDPQLWSYNWSIDRWFTLLYPEIEDVRIQQWYDQLRYGQIPTSKGPEARGQIEDWLIAQVTAMIEDEDEAPTFNEWCPWCSLKMDCPVVQYQLTDWALARIKALDPKGSPEALEIYLDVQPQVKRAAQVLKSFDETLTKVLKEMPTSKLSAVGKRKVERRRSGFSPEAKQAIIDAVGLATFLRLSDLSQAAVGRFYGDDKETAAWIRQLAEPRPSYSVIVDE